MSTKIMLLGLLLFTFYFTGIVSAALPVPEVTARQLPATIAAYSADSPADGSTDDHSHTGKGKKCCKDNDNDEEK